MINDIMALINNSIIACSDWLTTIFVKSGVSPIFFAFIFVTFAVKFILQPVIGKGQSSDRARKKANSGDSNE